MGRFSRKENQRKTNKVIRIYTEGEKTEPKYFNALKGELRLSNVAIKVVGKGEGTGKLVDAVLKDKGVDAKGYRTEWWIVLDKDDYADFDDAIKRAKLHGIEVAYSNVCFEVWFLLHFMDVHSGMGRRQYVEQLSKHLGRKYEKDSKVYECIHEQESEAIERVRKLMKVYEREGIIMPSKQLPSTLVYVLVERLRGLRSGK